MTRESSPSLTLGSNSHQLAENDLKDQVSTLALSGVAPESTCTTLPKSNITRDFGFLPIPKRLRYYAGKEHSFGLITNIAFGLTSTFTLASLYYCQPLLIQLALSFNVSYDEVAHIPTLFQAGYAAGLILISPLGDLVRRRPLIILIVALSTLLTVGLAVTKSLRIFEVISFLIGVLGVTPPILLTLAADVAPEAKRGTAISVVLSGLIFGILVARVLGGVIGNFASWRVVYYFAIGMQAFVLSMCFLTLPDHPSHNKDLSYFYILGTMAKFAVTEPQLVQAIPITIASAACFSNFWVTITFLLGEAPYNYSTLIIGLFGLIGMAGVAASPFVGQYTSLLVPWYAALTATAVQFCFQAIQTGAGGINIGAVVVVAFGIGVFRQLQHVAITTAVFEISASARVRLNAVLTLSVFIGQVMGTAVGSSVFVNHGWRASALFSLGLYGLQILLIALRGPHVSRYTWFGYEGGLECRKRNVQPDATGSPLPHLGKMEEA